MTRQTRMFGFIATILAVLGTNGFESFDSSARANSPVHALFDLDTPRTSPFPSDWFTVPDESHNTGRRVNLPLPDCSAHPTDCQNLEVINTLDGFNLQPRLSIPYC